MAKSNKGMVKRIAAERISILYDIAHNEFSNGADVGLAARHVKLMRKISMHYKVRMPKAIRRSICKKCNFVLIPGMNCTLRILAKDRSYIVTCMNCGTDMRVHFVS
ncbi:MAG: RNAase P [Candidatus Marsarchaeota archaeon]|jgi:ribonuclease P protein subunit RPR2|nr:RNAase P [Candidatus Marsarchaeota archaeon]